MSRPRLAILIVLLAAIGGLIWWTRSREAAPVSAVAGPKAAPRSGDAPSLAYGGGGSYESGGGSSTVAPAAQLTNVTPAATTLAATPKARIEGRVTNKDGTPIVGAAVRALTDTNRPVAQARVGADGAYELAVPAGRYTVEATAENHLPSLSDGIDAREETPTRGIDFVLSAGSKIYGVVLTPEGRPLQGATIQVMGMGGRGGQGGGRGGRGGRGQGGAAQAAAPAAGTGTGTGTGAQAGAQGGGRQGRGGRNGRGQNGGNNGGPGGGPGGGGPQAEGTATSDEHGEYAIRGLSEGDKMVVVRHDKFASPRPQQATVTEDDEARVDFTLVKGATVAGHVRDQQGKAIAGVKIDAQPENGRGGGPGGRGGGGRFGGNGSRAGNTDAAGYYKVEGLSGDRFTVNAQADGMAEAERSGVPAGAEDADLTMTMGSSISGTVVFQGGDLVPEAQVSLQGPTSNRTDAKEGQFRFDGLLPGRYTLGARVDTVASGTVEVRLDLGEQKDGVVLTALPTRTLKGRVVDSSGAAVAGAAVLLDAGGGGGGPGGGRGGGGGGDLRTIMQMTGMGPNGPGGQGAQGGQRGGNGGGGGGNGQNVTAADGSFSIPSVEVGQHVVRAVSPDYPSGEAVANVAAEGDPQPVIVRLPAAGSIVGQAFDEFDQAIAQANVIANGRGGNQRAAQTDDQGGFTINGLSADTYTVRLMMPGQQQQGGRGGGPGGGPGGFGGFGGGGKQITKQVGVVAGEPTHVEMRFAPGATVSGHVLLNGQPQPQVRVQLSAADALNAGQGSQTGDDGAFSFTDVQPGAYQIRAQNAIQAIVVGGANVVQDVTIPTTVVTGIVTDAQTGQPINRANVVIYVPAAVPVPGASGTVVGAAALTTNPMDQIFGRAQTAGDGAFRIEGVEAGTYTMTVQAQQYAALRRDKIVVAASTGGGDPAPIAFQLDEGGTLVGVVLDASNKPIAGARVVAQNLSLGIQTGGRGMPSALSGTDGTFTLKGLAAAQYDLVASATEYASSALVVQFDGTALQTTLHLTAGGGLTVRVVSSGGQPVAGAKVAFGALPAGAAMVPAVTTDQDGLAKFSNLVAGAYTGEVGLEGVPPAQFATRVSDGQTATAAATLQIAPPPKQTGH